MVFEKSCGAVIINRDQERLRYLLVRSRGGIWGFPKGHVIGEETEGETAVREIREETGLSVSFIDGFRCMDYQQLADEDGQIIGIKQVVYFLAEYSAQEAEPQDDEITQFRLMTYDEAMEVLNLAGRRRVLWEAEQFLSAIGLK